LNNAARCDKTDFVTYLIENGADVNSKNKQSRSAIHWAAYNNNVDMVKLMIKNGADVNQKDIIERNALLYCA